MELTVIFETANETELHWITVTGDRGTVRRMATAMASVDPTFCLRTSTGDFCRCALWGLRSDH